MASLQLTSLAFGDGESVPRKYGSTERNLNPPLEIDGVPDDADALALVVDDPGAVEPAGKVWDQWVVWNTDPRSETVPEDWDTAEAIEGQNDYGDDGYGGPNPRIANTATGFGCTPSTSNHAYTSAAISAADTVCVTWSTTRPCRTTQSGRSYGGSQ